ncbi:hypothetical protein DESC_910018 [Desulfosarcina cetonica]|nr:hypothetical protein DESC_910018 [Desulfosarcina cetonica]
MSVSHFGYFVIQLGSSFCGVENNNDDASNHFHRREVSIGKNRSGLSGHFQVGLALSGDPEKSDSYVHCLPICNRFIEMRPGRS